MCLFYVTFIFVIILAERILLLAGEKLFSSPVIDQQQDALIVCEEISMCVQNTLRKNQLYLQALSTMQLHDFLQPSPSKDSITVTSKHSIIYNDIRTASFPPLVLIHLSTPNNLYLVFTKISFCLRSYGWKLSFIITYKLEDPLEEHLELLKELVVQAGISFNSPVLVIIEMRDVSKLRAWEIYSIKNLPIIRQVQLSTEAGSVFSFEKLNGNFFRNFNMFNVPILGAAENRAKYYLGSQLRIVDGETQFVGGFAVDLFRDLSFGLNFTPKAVQGEGWPFKDEVTSQWIGTGRQVMAGEVDIGISATLQYASRTDFALLMPHYGGRIRAFFHQPAANSIRDIFKHTFDRDVWIMLIIVFLFTFCVMKLTIYLRKRSVEQSQCLNDTELTNDSALFIMASICQQGWFIFPTSTSLKIIFLCTTASGYLVYVYFSAALVSTLTNEIVPIRTAGQLKASSLSWIGEIYNPFVVSRLENMYNLDRGVLQERNLIINSSEANPVLRIALQPVAFLGFSDEFTLILREMNKSDKYFCDYISAIRISPIRLKSSMFVRKDNPLREYFNFGIIKNIERGLIYAHRERYVLRSRIKCDEKINSYREDLAIWDVFSAYVVLALGFIISFTEILAERYIFFKHSEFPFFR